MKILVIAPDKLPIPPIEGGSVETCIHTIFSRMARTDNITIVSSTYRNLPRSSKTVKGNLTIVRIPYPNAKAYIRTALRKMRKQSFDVIQVENRPTFIPLVRKTFPKTTIVLSLHSLTFLSRVSQNQGNAILQKVNGVTCVASSVANTFKRRFPKHAHKFKQALLGVDTHKFRPRTTAYKRKIRNRWGVQGTTNILFVGRIIRRKGLHTLVQAVGHLKKQHPNITIVAVGASWPGVKRETSYMRKVRRIAKNKGVSLRFTGYIPPKKVHHMYHLGDIFVCPTQFREGFALVNSEAMASGIPIVASARGGILEVVQHGKSGLLVKSYRNPKAFSRAIQRILSNRKLARKLAKAGRKRVVSQFSWSKTVKRLKQHYRKLNQ